MPDKGFDPVPWPKGVYRLLPNHNISTDSPLSEKTRLGSAGFVGSLGVGFFRAPLRDRFPFVLLFSSKSSASFRAFAHMRRGLRRSGEVALMALLVW